MKDILDCPDELYERIMEDLIMDGLDPDTMDPEELRQYISDKIDEYEEEEYEERHEWD